MQGQDLRQADLSNLSVQDMNAEQKAELRRRYDTFVRNFGVSPKSDEDDAKDKPVVKKWVPGMKADR